MARPDVVLGAVLCGGRSTRMGRDKALVEVDGTAMAVRVAAALAEGGCARVVAIGGDRAALTALGIEVVGDDHPGAGPLGGILTALRVDGGHEAVVAVGCDLPWLSGAVVREVVERRGDHDVAVATTDRREPLCAAWRRPAPARLHDAFVAGERAVHRALELVDVVEVPVDRAALRNINSPADLLGDHDGG